MFCNKHHVNTLTALLLAHGIKDAVVCPGSRNGIIVHNLNECQEIRLHPITDERSAAFVAIGIWLKTRKPVVICVTSGSALLNTLPGVAEAYYRHIPLIVISADRPEAWIGQLDGQTLPQPNALYPYAKSWQLTENEEDDWYCNRLINEAILATQNNGGQPVHINVPITEPLFEFSTPELPEVSVIRQYQPQCSQPIPDELLQEICNAKHPLVIIGQYENAAMSALLRLKKAGWQIYAENISNQSEAAFFEPETVPDFVLHLGGALVEKNIKLWLRTQNISVIRIDESDELPDTFCHLTAKVRCNPEMALNQIADALKLPPLQIMTTPHEWEALFLGNSTSVRWANRKLSNLADAVYCNRGTNGIEGSLSVAAGYSLVTDHPVLCVLGDLSFFYDCNALWNQHLKGNLRILLINNNRGDIFYKLPGLTASPALDEFVAAGHSNSARGIADSYHCNYIQASTNHLDDDYEDFLAKLKEMPSDRPVLFEINIQ